jgi:hypothetical protein
MTKAPFAADLSPPGILCHPPDGIHQSQLVSFLLSYVAGFFNDSRPLFK